jgi:phosphoribosylformylglycinamidine synthase
MVGKLPDPELAPLNAFTAERQVVALAGPFRPSLAGSELEKLRGSLADGLPAIDLAEHARALAVIRDAVRLGLVEAAHDVADGGIAVALAEMTIPNGIGVIARIPRLESPAAAPASDPGLVEDFAELAFGEAPGGVLLACDPEKFAELAAICAEIPFMRIGETGGNQFVLEGATASLTVQVEEAAKAYEEAVASSFQ